MGKNITTKLTIQNLTSELKKTFAKKTDLTPISNAAAAAFKSGKVTGNTVELFTSTDKTGAAAFSFDFPTEYFLDQAKSQFVQSFAFSAETYPGATDPSLEGKPVMVLAVKAEGGTEITYSFVDLTYLLNTYKAKVTGKDASTTITIDGYEIEVKVNISAEEGNQLQMKDDGLYVPAPAAVDLSGKADKVQDATAGNLAALDANGNLTDSGKKAGDFVEKVQIDGVEDPVVHESDISDYTAEEIAALLADAAEDAGE